MLGLHPPYDSRVVANAFIDIARLERDLIDPMKIQKLVYLAHGWYLAMMGEPLIKDPVQAWPYGPTIPELYHEMKQYGAGPISDYYMIMSPERKEFEIPFPSQEDMKFLKTVWMAYGPLTETQLSEVTHNSETPWADAYQRSDAALEIPNEKIQAYYKRYLPDAVTQSSEVAMQSNDFNTKARSGPQMMK